MDKELSFDEVHSFLKWIKEQPKDYMGGEFLYNIKGYYKRLRQEEIFDYWLDRVHTNKKQE